ncbi:MAG: DTW domain-containing protein [Kofleriaceae bacterium]|nr:DTW domain-containing protein [Kofleriaceae bacterium]
MSRDVNRCQQCRLYKARCLCADLVRVPCAVEVVVVRHILETHRNSNTGGLATRCLKGARLVEYANPESPIDWQDLVAGDTWLLYPKPGAKIPSELPERLIVVDGTWPQARRMVQRNKALYELPCLALPEPSKALPRMRKGARPEQMSTAESIATALHVLQQHAAAEQVEWALRKMIRQISLHPPKEC